MARKQVGRVPALADDAVDKQWAQEAISVKYTKPPQGIPTLDIAPSAVTLDRLQATGPPTPKTVLYGNGRWGVILGNFVVVQPQSNYTLQLPSDPSPVDGEMVMVEVHPSSTGIITVTIPTQIRLTSGLIRTYEVPPNTSCLLGLRWSDRISAWHLLTVANEI
jgi:hypothetical protein